jgi:hypothetical protein
VSDKADYICIKKSIAHWKRMITWVKEHINGVYNVYSSPTRMFMTDQLGEAWTCQFCSLCNKYFDDGCLYCPLYIKYGECDSSNHENLWGSVNDSKTWTDWIYNAEKFVVQLEGLLV